MNILALEVGTSTIQAAVLDQATGQPIGGIARTSVAVDVPSPDAAEIPALRLWDAVAATARQAVQQAGVAGRSGADIAAIGMSTFMPGLVLLGKDDQPLGPIWTHLDRRARPAARQVWAHVGEDIFASAGNRPLPGLMSALSWRQQHSDDPYLSHRVHSYLHVNGWLAFHMTGAKAFDPANASVTGLCGTMTDQAWSPRWCDYFEVEPAWLPPMVCGSATVGCLRAALASELGVPAGVPVKLGTADISTAMLAAHMEPGDVLHIVGATQTLATLAEKPAPAPRGRLHRLGVGADFVQIAHNPIGAGALAWIKNFCFREQTEAEFYEETIPLARQRSARVSLDPPFLAGDCLTIDASRAALRDLELTSDRLDVLAALLSALMQRHAEAIANLPIAMPLRRIFVSGAGVEWMRALIPDYQTSRLQTLDEGPLCGIARLFAEQS